VREAGLRVPDDIALAGWDDISVAALITPPLTTVAMPKRRLGAAAAGLLARQIPQAGKHEQVREKFPVELVIRQSSLLSAVAQL
jgi:DNA-binding LacI/PurR family transcriptional regulator